MPSDITGTEILDEDQGGARALRFVKGPIFAQIILADEINRTPPKTQAALLEAMQEYHVTAAGRTYPLERPFFVLATQNPIELEGTYPLPEAQLDRFMFNIVMTYLREDDEVRGRDARRPATTRPTPARVLSGADILQFQELVAPGGRSPRRSRATPCGWSTRRGRAAPGAPDFVEKWVKWGAGLRASQALVRGGKARALMHGRYHVSIKDIQALAKPILRHRIMTNFYAESERITSDAIVERLLETVPVPEERDVAMAAERARTPVPRPGGRRAARHARAEGADDRRRIPVRACTAARSRASASSSPSTGSTCPATTCRRSTGRSTRAAIATTSRSSRRRPTSTATCCST